MFVGTRKLRSSGAECSIMLSTGTERCGEKSAKEQSCTPEKQKASHSSGEPLMERTVMHPGKVKSKSFQW